MLFVDTGGSDVSQKWWHGCYGLGRKHSTLGHVIEYRCTEPRSQWPSVAAAADKGFVPARIYVHNHVGISDIRELIVNDDEHIVVRCFNCCNNEQQAGDKCMRARRVPHCRLGETINSLFENKLIVIVTWMRTQWLNLAASAAPLNDGLCSAANSHLAKSILSAASCRLLHNCYCLSTLSHEIHGVFVINSKIRVNYNALSRQQLTMKHVFTFTRVGRGLLLTTFDK